MHGLFIGCLLGGTVATVLFGVLGTVAGHFHLGHPTGHGATMHAHGSMQQHAAHTAPHGGPHHAHAAPGSGGAHGDSGSAIRASAVWALGWLSPLGLAAAALWFGGVGLIVERFGSGPALILAVVAAIVGAAIVRAIAGAFDRAGTPPLVLSGEGAIGLVNAQIRPGAPGEVLYTLEGLSRSTAARSVDDEFIPRGTEVVIVRRDRGMAWVSPLVPLDTKRPVERALPAQNGEGS